MHFATVIINTQVETSNILHQLILSHIKL